MKKIYIFLAFVLIFAILYRMDTKKLTTFVSFKQKHENSLRTVFNNYIIGKDTYQTLNEKIGLPTYFKDYTKAVPLPNFVDPSLLQPLFVNDTLFGVKYYPKLKDSKKFFKYLDNHYIQSSSYECCKWSNKYITISYEIDNEKNEYFLFFDKKSNYIKKFQ